MSDIRHLPGAIAALRQAVSQAPTPVAEMSEEDLEHWMSLHDAYLFFCIHRHRDAVPLLIDTLRLVQLRDDGVTVCVWDHLHDALLFQTGKDLAWDQAAWRSWWETEGKKAPEPDSETMGQKGEPGATDNPDDAQRLREDH